MIRSRILAFAASLLAGLSLTLSFDYGENAAEPQGGLMANDDGLVAFAVDEETDGGGEDTQGSEAAVPFKAVMIPLGTNGDCTILDYGNTEILIDAGGNMKSAPAIFTALNEYVTDGKIEMIVITHSDNDHLVSFANAGGVKDWLNIPGHSCDYLIDFDFSQDPTVSFSFKKNFFMNELNSQTDEGDDDEKSENGDPTDDVAGELAPSPYLSYKTAREQLVTTKKIKTYLSASECTYRERGVDPTLLRAAAQEKAKSLFVFDSDGKETASTDNAFSFRILYNYFYDHPLDASAAATYIPTSCEINLISVCTLAEIGGEKFLFTGDLMEYNSASSYSVVGGEKRLIENNEAYLKDGVLFYKAAHHGSMTSSSPAFLDVIRPQYVGIECKASTIGFSFPSDTVLARFLRWTDYVYITEGPSDDETGSFHGKTILSLNAESGDVNVDYANALAPESLLQSAWVYQNKNLSFNVYNLAADNSSAVEAECTYIKIGHYDIIVNCGGYLTSSSYLPSKPLFLDSVKHYCNDRFIDLIILSGSGQTDYFDLVGRNKNGLLYNPGYYFKGIGEMVITSAVSELSGGVFASFNQWLDEEAGKSKFVEKITYGDQMSGLTEPLIQGPVLQASLHFLNHNGLLVENRVDVCSIPFVLSVGDVDYLNLGRLTDEYEEFMTLFQTNEGFFDQHDIEIMTFPKFGRAALVEAEASLLQYNKILDATTRYILCPGSYGTTNSDGDNLYPAAGFISNQLYAKIVYASTFADRSTSIDRQGDLDVVTLFKQGEATRLSIRSEVVDQGEFKRFDAYQKAHATPAASFLD